MTVRKEEERRKVPWSPATDSPEFIKFSARHAPYDGVIKLSGSNGRENAKKPEEDSLRVYPSE